MLNRSPKSLGDPRSDYRPLFPATLIDLPNAALTTYTSLALAPCARALLGLPDAPGAEHDRGEHSDDAFLGAMLRMVLMRS